MRRKVLEQTASVCPQMHAPPFSSLCPGAGGVDGIQGLFPQTSGWMWPVEAPGKGQRAGRERLGGVTPGPREVQSQDSPTHPSEPGSFPETGEGGARLK